jgi:hypothetical protein
MATLVLTRNNRGSMAPATAANALRTVTPQRSTSNYSDPLRRSRCRWSSRAHLNYEGVDREILISRAKLCAITGQTNVQQFPRLANRPSDKPKKILNENRRRSTPLCCQIARIWAPRGVAERLEQSQVVAMMPQSVAFCRSTPRSDSSVRFLTIRPKKPLAWPSRLCLPNSLVLEGHFFGIIRKGSTELLVRGSYRPFFCP